MSTTHAKEFGKQISLLRKAQGLSQADLSKISGVPITAIRRCEQLGQIPLDRYLALASVLNASLKIHSAATELVRAEEEGSIPTPFPYQTIEEVIAAAKTKAVDCPQINIHKPRLGGLFQEQLSQVYNRA